MKIYLDDNRAEKRLANLLRKAGHELRSSADAGLAGAVDARHLEYAIRLEMAVLTNDRDDFRDLHQLVQTAGGRHWGILVVRFEKDSSKSMKARDIVAAIGRLQASGISYANEIVVLNQWR